MAWYSVRSSKLARTLKNVISSVVGFLEVAITMALVMTWVYHYNSDRKSVLLSIPQFLVFVGAIYSHIIIPISYSQWMDDDKVNKNLEKLKSNIKHGRGVLLGYIIIEATILGLGIAFSITRAVLYFPLPTDDESNTVADANTVNLALIIITASTIVTSTIGVILGLALRMRLDGIVDTLEGSQYKDKEMETEMTNVTKSKSMRKRMTKASKNMDGYRFDASQHASAALNSITSPASTQFSGKPEVEITFKNLR